MPESAVERQQASLAIQAAPSNHITKSGSSFVEISTRSPINEQGEHPVPRVNSGVQSQSNPKAKSQLKLPLKKEKTIIDPNLTSEIGASTRNQTNLTRESSRGWLKAGLTKQVTLDSNFELKSQTQKQPSRKNNNCTP